MTGSIGVCSQSGAADGNPSFCLMMIMRMVMMIMIIEMMIMVMMMMLMRRVVMVMMMMMVYVLSAGGTTVTRARGNVRRPAFLPLPPSRYQHPRFHLPKREREWLSCLVLSCISNNLHFEARHQASGCRGWWRCAASSAGKDWSLVQSQSLLLVSACPPKPGWELRRRDSSPAPP